MIHVTRWLLGVDCGTTSPVQQQLHLEGKQATNIDLRGSNITKVAVISTTVLVT